MGTMVYDGVNYREGRDGCTFCMIKRYPLPSTVKKIERKTESKSQSIARIPFG